MDRFVEDGSLDDNVESFLSHDEMDPRETMGRGMDVAKGASLSHSLIFFNTYPLFLHQNVFIQT